jgi:hypothetical protein
MFRFAKLDFTVLLLLGTSPCLSPDLCLHSLGLILVHCNLLWTFLHVFIHCIIGRIFTPRPFLVLSTP